MTEYIERGKAIDACFNGWNNDAHDCAENIRQIPAAGVRPAVKAFWIGEGDGYADSEMVYDVWLCSNCDYIVDEGDNEPPRYNFCPNCGADMREES